MQYGTITEYEAEGDNAKQTTIYFRGGKEMTEKRRTVIEKKRVSNRLEEAAEYHSFSNKYHDDPTMLNPTIAVEGKEQWVKGSNDYYYVVLSYMQVEHG